MLVAVAALLALSAIGCTYEYRATASGTLYTRPAYVIVDTPPPPLRATVSVMPPKPHANAVWVDAYWAWRGGRWVWVEGYWETPRPGYVWTPPVAVRGPRGHIEYHPGYWRRHHDAPPPVYRDAGDIRVSVRPAQPHVHVREPEPRPHVHVQPAQPRDPHVHVQPAQPARPDVHVQPAQPARPHVHVQPATPAQPARPHVGVQPATPAQPARPHVGVRPGVVVQPAQPAEPARPGVHLRPGVVNDPQGGPVRPAPGGGVTPGGRPGVRAGGEVNLALTCSVNTSRAPLGGMITISGSGFGPGTVVQIGGRTAVIENQEGGRLRVRVPTGGAVTVSDGGRQASCGSIEIVGGR